MVAVWWNQNLNGDGIHEWLNAAATSSPWSCGMLMDRPSSVEPAPSGLWKQGGADLRPFRTLTEGRAARSPVECSPTSDSCGRPIASEWNRPLRSQGSRRLEEPRRSPLQNPSRKASHRSTPIGRQSHKRLGRSAGARFSLIFESREKVGGPRLAYLRPSPPSSLRVPRALRAFSVSDSTRLSTASNGQKGKGGVRRPRPCSLRAGPL
jgi:hypothetical protein